MKIITLLFIPVVIITLAFRSPDSFKVSGIITGGVGNPIINATITEKGIKTKNVVTSDHLGRYSIKLSSPNATIVISSFKYTTTEIKVNGRKKIDVILQPSQLKPQD